MRVLIITQYFYPENNFRSTEMATELVKRGHTVDALVGIPNYPKGKYFDGYGLFKKRHEVLNGVNVYRAFQTPRGKGGWRLPINYFSFVISACFRILFQFAWKKKYDAVIVYEPSPVFQAIPAILYKKLRGTPVYFWIMDIWPDAMMSGGGVKNQRLLKSVAKVVRWIYDRCDKLMVCSKRMADSVMEQGDYKDKLLYYPNWSEDMKKGNQAYPLPEMAEGYRIMMIGNLGKSQNLDAVAPLIKELQDIKELKWIFVGDGSERGWLDDYIKDNSLEDCAYTLGRFPYEAMPAMHQAADALILALRPGFKHLERIVPSRLQSYMSAGKPVLAMLGVGGKELIEEADCGYAVEPGDYKALADIIRHKVLTDKDAFAKKGRNGRDYYEKNFTIKICIDNLEKIIGAVK